MSTTPNLVEILAHLGDGLSVFDKSRQVTFANDKASQILNSTDEAFYTRITHALSEGTPKRFEYFHVPLNRWFEHQTYPNADGGMTVFSRDITSRRRVENALRASEERFRRLIESNIIGVVVADSEFVTEANDVFLQMVGCSRDELVRRGIRWRDMTPPEYDELDRKALHELESTGVFSPYEKELIRKDGGRVAILVGGVVTQTEPIEAFSLVLDLSERKRSEQRIRHLVDVGRILATSLEFEETFAELAEFVVSKLADCCVIFVKEEGKLRRLTAAYAAAAGPADPGLNVDRVLMTGKPELTLAPSSTAILPIIVREEVAGILAVCSGKPDAYNTEDLHFFEILGRRMGLALDNSRLYRDAQRANRLKDEFVAIVSHELRTPLTPILGGVYMLRTEARDTEVFERALNLIERNAKTQVKIVDDLLDVSRIISGKLRLHLEPVDLGHVIRAALETVRPACEAKGIEIQLRLEALGPVVVGDADRLQQIVWNLLANSVKFTPDAGRITIELMESGGFAEIRVTDNGIGIDPDFLPYVFERFRQANTSRTRIHGGLGLGLAIVRHLVESHGGTVHAESSGDEQGSTFIVRLPMRPVIRGQTYKSPNYI